MTEIHLKAKMDSDDGLIDKDLKLKLTDEHPQSSYGIPVLLSSNGTAWGINDGNEITTARSIVSGFLKQYQKTLLDNEINFVKKFLLI